MNTTRNDVRILRAHLPTPDAVIVRHPCGTTIVVADHTLPEDHVNRLADEAATLRRPTHAVG